MDAMITISVSPSEYVPEKPAERVAWLERHGLPPAQRIVQVTASLATWARYGANVGVDGTVDIRAWNGLEKGLVGIAAKRFASGESEVSLTDEDVGRLADEKDAKREAERAAKVAEERAKEEADRAAVEKIRAQGLEAILVCKSGEWASTYVPDSTARTALVKLALGADAYDRADVEATSRNGRAAREFQAAQEEARAWLVAQGAEAGFSAELVRAAKEGRKVTEALASTVTGWIGAALKALPEGRGMARSFEQEERDDVPTPAAYALLDALVAAKEALASAAKIPGVAITIEPISRHEINPKVGAETWRTGNKVLISHPWLGKGKNGKAMAYAWTVLAEAPALPDDEDDDDGDDD